MDCRLLVILSRKDELVKDFPAWMLSEDDISRFQAIQNKALVEIAGRDSIAAALEAARTEALEAMLPTIAYTGTEYGNWRDILKNIEFLRLRLKDLDVEVFPPVVQGAPAFWWKLCGQRLGQHFDKYGMYSPCVGCHLYLHALRIPLAQKLNCLLIVAGSREFHDQRPKINQTAQVLDAYQDFAAKFGVRLLFPLRQVQSGRQIKAILGKKWPEGDLQLKCVLSRNYASTAYNPDLAQDKALQYLREFAFKLAAREIKKFLA
jgi:hypothetical protein